HRTSTSATRVFSSGKIATDLNGRRAGRFRRRAGAGHGLARCRRMSAMPASIAAGAALFGLDERLGEGPVHLLHQRPAALVAHAEARCRGGERSGLVDRLEQVRLARPDRHPGLQHDAKAEALLDVAELRHAGILAAGAAAPISAAISSRDVMPIARSAILVPRRNMTTRSAIAKASSTLWLAIRIAVPASRNARARSRTFAACATASAAVGSSRRRRTGRATSARASATTRRSPADMAAARRPLGTPEP